MRYLRKYILLFAALLTVLPVLAQDDDAFFYPFLPSWLDNLLSFVTIIVVPAVVIILFVGMGKKVFRTIWYVISLQPLRRRRLRERLSAQLEYYRDLPAEGNLHVANAVMNSLSSAWMADYGGLFGAMILRLVDSGALRIVTTPRVYGVEDHPQLVIGTLPDGKDAQEKHLGATELAFYELLKKAAGADGVLQPRELQQYVRNNKDDQFFTSLTSFTEKEQQMAKDTDTAVQLLGLRKFLLDFSLIAERGIKEMPLWREYLVYATLFGIADKVSENFAEVYSDYFKMNAIAGTQLSIVGNNALFSYVDATLHGVD